MDLVHWTYYTTCLLVCLLAGRIRFELGLLVLTEVVTGMSKVFWV